MSTLLHDKAKCSNGYQCPQRETCLRWITPSCGPDQIDAAFFIAGVERCSGYWPTQEGAGMIILSKEQVAELRQFVIGAAHPPVPRDELHGLCDTAEFGLRVIEMEQRIRRFVEGEMDALSPENLARCNIHKLSDYSQGQRDLLNRLKELLSNQEQIAR